VSSLEARARDWLEGDPDPETRAELAALLQSGNAAELAERLGPELDFGTAGLRGPVGAGPARMNVAVVVRAVRALAEHLLERVPDASALGVVVGFDARPTSRKLAEAAVGVLLAAGISVRLFERATPTPLVAYAARSLGSAAALVVTASHNPKADNGLKVYGPDAAQLVAPADADVARRRAALGPASSIPRAPLAEPGARVRGAMLSSPPSELFERYLAELDAALPPRRANARRLRVAYTALHGLGSEPVGRALALRGFSAPELVLEQSEPDGAFPTVPFPNPELAGVLDRVLDLGRMQGSELVLASDPDVDRLAAAAPSASGELYVFTGNELGALLADFVLERAPPSPTPLFVTSLVSSPLLDVVARARGARVERTLTGFKWIWAAARALEASEGVRFAFGCEEALGYSVGQLVRDKDGISAALWLAELAAECLAEGRTLVDRLHALLRRHGAWSSAQQALTFPGQSGARALGDALDALVAAPPATLGGAALTAFIDYREGAELRPVWRGAQSLFELELGPSARVLVRPSGTEPKLKIYADVLEPLAASEAASAAMHRARSRAEALAHEVARLLSR